MLWTCKGTHGLIALFPWTQVVFSPIKNKEHNGNNIDLKGHNKSDFFNRDRNPNGAISPGEGRKATRCACEVSEFGSSDFAKPPPRGSGPDSSCVQALQSLTFRVGVSVAHLASRNVTKPNQRLPFPPVKRPRNFWRRTPQGRLCVWRLQGTAAARNETCQVHELGSLPLRCAWLISW